MEPKNIFIGRNPLRNSLNFGDVRASEEVKNLTKNISPITSKAQRESLFLPSSKKFYASLSVENYYNIN
jgi:hypothetical protein